MSQLNQKKSFILILFSVLWWLFRSDFSDVMWFLKHQLLGMCSSTWLAALRSVFPCHLSEPVTDDRPDDSKSSEYDRGEILIKHAHYVHLICVLSLVCSQQSQHLCCVVWSRSPCLSCLRHHICPDTCPLCPLAPGRALLTEPVKPRAVCYKGSPLSSGLMTVMYDCMISINYKCCHNCCC
mgnify:CR=1 FL=1